MMLDLEYFLWRCDHVITHRQEELIVDSLSHGQSTCWILLEQLTYQSCRRCGQGFVTVIVVVEHSLMKILGSLAFIRKHTSEEVIEEHTTSPYISE